MDYLDYWIITYVMYTKQVLLTHNYSFYLFTQNYLFTMKTLIFHNLVAYKGLDGVRVILIALHVHFFNKSNKTIM